MVSLSNKLLLKAQPYCNLLASLFILSLYWIAVETPNSQILFKFSLDIIVSLFGLSFLLFRGLRQKYLFLLILLFPLFFNPMLWLLDIPWVKFDSIRYNPFVFKLSYLLYFTTLATVAITLSKERFFEIYSKISYYCAWGSIILFCGYLTVGLPVGVSTGYGFPRAQFFSNEPSTFAPIVLAGACSNFFIQKKILRSLVCFLAFCLAQSTSGIFALFLALATLGSIFIKDSLLRLVTNRLRRSDSVTLGVLLLLFLGILATITLLPVYAPKIYNVAYARLFRDLDLLIRGEWMSGSDRLQQLSDWLEAIRANFWFGWGAYSDIYLFPSPFGSTVGTIFKFILWGGIGPFLVFCGLLLNLIVTASRYEIVFVTIISTSVLIAAPGVQYDAILLFSLVVFMHHTLRNYMPKKTKNHLVVNTA